MTVREHRSQHESAEALPLISEAATVTTVEAMDRDRRDEVHGAVRSLADEHGLEGVDGDDERIDWARLFDEATRIDPRLVGRIGAMRDRYERAHPALLRIEIETNRPVDFVAGQYVTLRYDGRSRPYSVASSPTRDELELCIRRVPAGKLSPKLCDELAVGDRVTVRGPNGHLYLEDRTARDLAFFATGTGVAPLKSMIDYAFETGYDTHDGRPRDVWLFLGAAWADDLPYHEAFLDRAAAYDNFHYVPCLSRESWLTDWSGETDYIQETVLKYVDERHLEDAVFGRHIAELLAAPPAVDIDARIDPGSLEVYACGINAMVYSLETAVRHLGVGEGHVHCEGYG